MSPAGERIDLQLRLSGGRVAAVDVVSGRTATAAAALEGKTVEDALALLPLLFALCGVGQLTAGLRAVEAALDIEVSPEEGAARAVLVASETVSEHAVRMVMDWPLLAGLAPDVEAARRVRAAAAAVQRVLYPDPRTRARVGGGATVVPPVLMASVAELVGVVEANILGCAVEEMVAAEGLESWLDRAGVLPAVVMRWVLAAGLADAGGAAPAASPLPSFDPRLLAARFEATDVAAFLREPRWQGVAHETGPFARAGGHPAVSAMTARLGAGVLPRLLARVVETAILAQKIVRLASKMCDSWPFVGHGQAAAIRPREGAVRWGTSAEEIARGRVVHHVMVANGRVARWRILAPTEWNFQTRGPLAAAVSSLPAKQEAWVRQAAEWLVMAFDPCVACHVRVDAQGRPDA